MQQPAYRIPRPAALHAIRRRALRMDAVIRRACHPAGPAGSSAAERTEAPRAADDNAFNQLLASIDAANARVTQRLRCSSPKVPKV